jgi:hypothetical protein
MDKPITLTVGETVQLKRFKDRIAYGGMPSDNAYSIVQIRTALSSTSAAWNLFYPKSRTRIVIDGVNISVLDVTADAIKLKIGTWE